MVYHDILVSLYWKYQEMTKPDAVTIELLVWGFVVQWNFSPIKPMHIESNTIATYLFLDFWMKYLYENIGTLSLILAIFIFA